MGGDAGVAHCGSRTPPASPRLLLPSLPAARRRIPSLDPPSTAAPLPSRRPPPLPRYYNDTWAFNLEELKWEPLGPRPGAVAPSPRGGCQLALAGDLLFCFGGYSVRKAEPEGGESQLAGGRRAARAGVRVGTWEALAVARCQGAKRALHITCLHLVHVFLLRCTDGSTQ